ncbi:MAG TPA: methyltransferase [Kofleriaceae bacterium]|nr:methyltransferase [Kofleriaceae bacterium]
MTTSDKLATDLTRLWQMLDLITPMALRVAATLRIADHIQAGHDRMPDLAARTGADPDALARLLRYLVAHGVFTEPEPGRFGLDDLAELLLDSHPRASRRWLDLEGFGGRMDLAFFELLATVRDGRPPHDGHKDSLTGEVAASYDDVMESQSRADAPALVAAFDWTGIEHVADLGGGTGTFLATLLAAQPALRGSLVELPATADAAGRLLAEAGLAGRSQVVAGDLLQATLPRADLYVLKFVLHSFDDADAIRALERCRGAGGQDTRVLVIERTLLAEGDRGEFTAMDMRMLILGHGRERTLEQYSDLAGRAGFALGKVTTVPAPYIRHLIELHPLRG